MKLNTVTLILALMLAGVSQLAAQAAVGSIAPDNNYASFASSGALTDATMYSHGGKIVVAYYYTPT